MVTAIATPSLNWAKPLLQFTVNERLKPQHRKGNNMFKTLYENKSIYCYSSRYKLLLI